MYARSDIYGVRLPNDSERAAKKRGTEISSRRDLSDLVPTGQSLSRRAGAAAGFAVLL